MRNLLTLCLMTLALAAEAQMNRYVCVTLDNATKRCGELISDDGRELVLETPNVGRVVLNKAQIILIQDADYGTTPSMGAATNLDDRAINPDRSLQATRYFFAPSALPLKQGEGYGTFSAITGGNLSYGVSDNAILGLSATWLGAGISAKQSFRLNDNTHASIGGMFQLSFGSGEPTMFPFANVTKGDENLNVTLGVGYLTGGGGEINSPMVNLSGCYQVSERLWMMSENYYFANPAFFPANSVVSVGARTAKPDKSRLFEIAILFVDINENTSPDTGFAPLPWLSWTWPF